MNKHFITLYLLFFSSLMLKATIHDFPNGRDGAVQFTIGETIYVGAGIGSSGTLQTFYKKSMNTNYYWSSISAFPGAARTNAVSFTLNGKGYVGLGRESYGGNLLNDFYCYDPAVDTWTKSVDFGGTARYGAVCFVINNVAYVGTGNDASGSCSDFWSFDGTTWTKLSATFTGDKRVGACAFVVDGKAYVSGGMSMDDGTIQQSDVQEFDPQTNQWTEKVFADGINLSVNNAAAFTHRGKGYICYGNKKQVVTYDPATNEVENLGDVFGFNDSRNNPIAFLFNGIPYVGLGSSGVLTTSYHNDFKALFSGYSIKFNGNGNDGGIAPNAVAGETSYTFKLPDAGSLTKHGYKFVGWNAEADYSGRSYAPGETYRISYSNITLFAEWITENEYLIDETDIIISDEGYMYDSGGPFKDHKLKNDIITIKPATKGNRVVFTFEALDLYLHIAKLYVYDGDISNAALIGEYHNLSMLSSPTIVASNPEGALTFRFKYETGTNISDLGWKGRFTSVPPSVKTMSFNGNGHDSGTVPSAITQEIGTSFALPDAGDLHKEGQQFIRWNTKPDGTGYALAAGDAYRIGSEDVTFYAEWQQPAVNDLFDLNEQGVVISDACTLKQYLAANSVYQPNRDRSITFLPKTKGEQLMISFENEANILEGGNLYLFNGVSKNAEILATKGYNIKNPSVVYSNNEEGAITVHYIDYPFNDAADWVALIKCAPHITLSFDANGAEGMVESIRSFPARSVKLPDAKPLTFGEKVFVGWNTKADGSGKKLDVGNKFTLSSVDATLYAQWEAVSTEDMILISQGGTVVTDGCLFYDTGGTEPFVSNRNDSITFVPATKGSKLRYTIEQMDVNGYELKVVDGISSKAPVLNRYYNKMSGQGMASNSSGALSFYYQVHGNLYSNAGWRIKIESFVPVEHTITFYGNGHDSGNVPSAITVLTTDNIVLPGQGNLTKTGRVLAGWNTRADGKGKWYIPNKTMKVTDDVELYAIWGNLISEQGTITSDRGFFFDSGNLENNYSDNEDYTITFIPETPNKMLRFYFERLNGSYLNTGDELCVYNGTSTNAELLKVISQGFTGEVIANNAEGALTFQFKSNGAGNNDGWCASYAIVEPRSIIFDGNGHTTGKVPDSFTDMPNTQVKIPGIGNMVREGYSFKYWATSPNGGGDYYFENYSITIKYEDLVLYAIWDYDGSNFFDVKSVGPTCKGYDDGAITVVSKLPNAQVYVKEMAKTFDLIMGEDLVIDGLSPGAYNLSITAGDVVRNFTVNVKAIEPIKGIATVKGSSVSFEMQGGEPPYTLIIGDETYTAEANNIIITNLKSGSHQVTLQDANYCTDDVIIRIDVEELYVYPNPASGEEINIVIPSSLHDTDCVIKVFTLDGSWVKSKQVTEGSRTSINVSDLPSGLYLVKVESEIYQGTVRVVIQE